MSDSNIEVILEKLEILDQKIDSFDTIHIKNGNGREIMYHRAEFYQMLYDWKKDFFNAGSEISKKIGNYLDLLMKLISIGAIIFTAIKLGGK